MWVLRPRWSNAEFLGVYLILPLSHSEPHRFCRFVQQANHRPDAAKSHGVAIVGSRFEIFPYVVLESLAAGVATVATDVGGVSEIIRDGETGVLVPSEDPNRMARACLTLLNNRSLCQSLGTTARQDMHARFSPREIAKQLVSFLETVSGSNTVDCLSLRPCA